MCVCVCVYMYIKNIKFTVLTIFFLIFKHGNDTVGFFFFFKLFNLLELQTKNFTDKTT